MTLLVSKNVFQKEILEHEEALHFFHRICEAPDNASKVILAMSGADKQAMSGCYGITRQLWELYKEEGEELVRSILELRDDIYSDM